MPLPPEVQALVVGLLTNALSAIGQATFRAAVAEGTTDERSVERFAAQTLSGSLVLDAVARDLEEPEGLPDELLDAARTVLQMPDTQSVVHEVLTLRLLEVPDREVDQARAGLAGTVRWACPWLDQARSVELEGLLFGLLDRGCRALVEHLDSADTVTRASIQQLAGLSALTATVRSLERHVASLADRGAATAQGWSAYTEEYVNQVVQRHGWLTLPDFEIERRIEVNALYVEPTIWATNEAHISTVEDLVQRTVRSVLLGNPGGGKSTLASVLAFRVATSGSRVPFVVVLREYGPDYVDGLSIVQHLEKVLNTRYQAAPPEGWVEGVLLAGNGVLIFDGLDELVETTKRREIKNAVEAFCERFPQVRVLVTSRKIGYEQAPLSPHRFTLAHLDEFGNGAVERYAQLWFEHSLPHLSPTERSDRAAGFLRESESVEELRSNPLLLSLMCVLYRGSNYIPESRLDLYEECAKLLFIKWDRSRDIEVPLEIGPDISPAISQRSRRTARSAPLTCDDVSRVGRSASVRAAPLG